MQRRKFIKKTVFGIPTIVWLPTLSSCNKDDDIPQIISDKKVIIIGAGIAGLGAAKYFKDRSVDVVVIEAQEKIGGRLRTDRSLGVAFDEGASWIHGPDGNPITPLANASGANTFLTDDDNSATFNIDGSAYADILLDNSEKEYNNILENINGSINQSFQSVFFDEYPQYQNDRLWNYMMSAFLEFDIGGDISEISSLDYYDDKAFAGADIIITNGYDKVADYLAIGIDVRLNTKVIQIDYSNEKTQVITDQKIFEADFVLITVPLGVLKENIITFSPSLPDSINQAINNLKMGSVNKFLCIWDNAFWDTDLQYIGFTPDTKGKFNYFMNLNKFADTNALMTFAFGNYSQLTESMTDAKIIDEIMSHLKSIYGDNIPNPTNMLRTKWISNEYTFGSYSFATNGTRSRDFEIFEKSINSKLFFAGEHTSKDYRGTVHGAYLSGMREAENIIGLL